MNTENQNTGDILLYQDQDGKTTVEVKFENDTVRLSQKQMAILFDKDVNTIGEHIQNVFHERELNKNSTSRKFRVVQPDLTKIG